MLKLILISLFTIMNVMAQEPESVFVVSNGKMIEINFKKLKRVEISTTNYHPKFIGLGEIKYSGYLVKDILANVNLKPSDYITIVGKTGQFSIELSANELLAPNNIIATHVNGIKVKTENKGLQIIYSKEAVSLFPNLKKRQYWCWWVRSIITDDKFTPTMSVVKANKTLESKLPWPVPNGISSREEVSEVKLRAGKILKFNKAKINLLNGASIDLIRDQKTQFFLTDSLGSKSGAFGLHQVVEVDGKVHAFVASHYYVKNIEVIK